jgi:hypothetical protein
MNPFHAVSIIVCLPANGFSLITLTSSAHQGHPQAPLTIPVMGLLLKAPLERKRELGLSPNSLYFCFVDEPMTS